LEKYKKINEDVQPISLRFTDNMILRTRSTPPTWIIPY